MRTSLAGWLVAFVLLVPSGADAHPHVFVDAKTEIVYDETHQVTSVRHAWVFDEAFTAMAILGLDVDGDGTYTREELQPLAKVNVESLNEYKFFTFLKNKGKNIAFAEPKDYWLEYDGSKLTLHFTLPLKTPLPSTTNPVVMEVYDPEYFVSFLMDADNPVQLAGAHAGCRHDVKRPEQLDTAAATTLSQIPAEMRELPPELSSLTAALVNRITVTCG